MNRKNVVCFAHPYTFVKAPRALPVKARIARHFDCAAPQSLDGLKGKGERRKDLETLDKILFVFGEHTTEGVQK